MFNLSKTGIIRCSLALLPLLLPTSQISAASLQSLLDQGGHVQLSAGTHRITEPLVIDLDETGWTSLSGHGVTRLVMTGPGPAIRIFGTHDGTANPQTVDAGVWKNQRMPLIDGIEIIGDHPEANGNLFDRNPRYRDPAECPNGVIFRNCEDTTVTGLHLNQTTGEAGLLLENCRRMNINQCTLLDCENSGMLARNLTESRISNCLISHDTAGDTYQKIRLIDSNRNQIQNDF